MSGFGIYTWPGGRKYVGFYANDEKQGYGMYYWNDGRIFEGWWAHNKQCGPGKYITPNGKNKLMQLIEPTKFGLWENGKRIVWFTEEQIEQVRNGTFDYTVNYENPNTKAEISKTLKFDPPSNFESNLLLIRTAFPEYCKELS